MAEQKWLQRYAEGIVISVLSTIVLAVFAYLTRVESVWLKPMLYGIMAACSVAITGIALVFLRRAPRPRIVPSEKNIEQCVRGWLDAHRIAVKNDPWEGAFFRLQITLDGGEHMTVIRSKSFMPEYVQIVADLGVRGDEKKLLQRFTENEKTQMLFDMKIELARAKVGYSGLVDPPENFQVFRRVPIYSTLTEFAFISMIGDVEAAMHLVAITFLEARWKKELSSPTSMLPSVSDTPALEPPVA